VNLNTPNRVLEEFAYQKVVRTTRPEKKGPTPPRRKFVPGILISELTKIAEARPGRS
jgi:hypothetical protein